jgi:two-component system chemotaxis response regulator CheY
MSLTILIVDDSRVMRSVVKVSLQSGLACEFRETGDGAEALKLLETGPFDVVIADINMPVMNGITFVKNVRASPRPELKAIPIVLLTAEVDREKEGLAAGADAFIRKTEVKSGSHLVDTVKRLAGSKST